MEKKHGERVQELNPEAKEKTFLLREFAGNKESPHHRQRILPKAENLEIKDPMGLSDEVYKEVAEEIKSVLQKALPRILEYLGK